MNPDYRRRRPPFRRRLDRSRLNFRVLLASTVIAASVYLFAPRVGELILTLHLDPFPLSLAVLVQVLYVTAQAERQRRTLEAVTATRIPAISWLQLFSLGRIANLVLVQGGNIYQASRLRHSRDLPVTQYATGQVGFAWLSLVLTLTFATVTSLASNDSSLRSVTWFLGLATVLVVSAPLALARGLDYLPPRVSTTKGIASVIRAVDRIAATLSNAPFLRTFAALSLATFILGTLVLYMIFTALGVQATLATFVLYYALQHLSTILLITPGNLGLQELAFFGATHLWLEIDPALPVLASLVGRGLVFLAASAIFLSVGAGRRLAHSARE